MEEAGRGGRSPQQGMSWVSDNGAHQAGRSSLPHPKHRLRVSHLSALAEMLSSPSRVSNPDLLQPVCHCCCLHAWVSANTQHPSDLNAVAHFLAQGYYYSPVGSRYWDYLPLFALFIASLLGFLSMTTSVFSRRKRLSYSYFSRL